jgi:hypothetical protein
MKLTFKLPLAFATAMLVLLCAALYGIHNLNQAITTYGTTQQTSQQNAAAASDLLAQFKAQVQEWKNTLLRGKDAAALDKRWGAFNRIEADMRPTLQAVATRLPAGESRQLVEKFAQSHTAMGVNYRKAFRDGGMDREPAKPQDEAAARIAADGVAAAARAGVQGRGFAVVASEVRSLTVRSAAAAKEIKTLIDASVERVGQGTALVDEAGSTMAEIVSSIQCVSDIMGEISAASSQQSSGVSQVGDAVSQMDQATQQNPALVEERAAAASLQSQSRQLVEAVVVFRLG